MQETINFVYDDLKEPTESIVNGRHKDCRPAYHLSIPTILKKNYNVNLYKKNDIKKLDKFYYILTFNSVYNTLSSTNNLLQLIDSDIISAICQKKCKIIFSNINEDSPVAFSYKKIKPHIERLGLTIRNTFFLGCGYEKCVKNFLSFDYFEAACHLINDKNLHLLNMCNTKRIFNIKQKKISKRFLCLNRVPRWHRMVLVYLFWKNNLLKYINASFPKTFYDTSMLVTHKMSATHPVFKKIINNDNLSNFFEYLPLKVDTSNFYNNPWDTVSESFICSNGINIISETLFDKVTTSASSYITEKTFKSIMYRMPFIIVGCPNTLEHLHNYGYKTFGSLWDESYDSELDPTIRFCKIYDIIKSLCSLPENELYALYSQAQNIADENYNIFIKRTPANLIFNFLNSNF